LGAEFQIFSELLPAFCYFVLINLEEVKGKKYLTVSYYL
jgi:hypothetical protein